MTDEDRAFRAWAQAELADAPLAALPEELHSRRRIEPRVWAVVGAVATVIALAAGLLVLRGVGDGRNDAARPPGPVGSDSLNSARSGAVSKLVVRDGDVVRGTGAVESLPGKPIRFCVPFAFELLPRSEDRSRPPCPGVVVTGVDLGRLSQRSEAGGVVDGRATLTGVYRQGRFRVTAQEAESKAEQFVLPPVPCRPPAGGWGETDQQNVTQTIEHIVTPYRRAHPGVVVQLAVLHPSKRSNVLYLLVDADPAGVRDALEPRVGKNLCVVRSRYTATQVATAKRVISAQFRRGLGENLTRPTSGGGFGLGPDAQVTSVVQVPIVSERFARLMDAQPAGLVTVNAWLAPVR